MLWQIQRMGTRSEAGMRGVDREKFGDKSRGHVQYICSSKHWHANITVESSSF